MEVLINNTSPRSDVVGDVELVGDVTGITGSQWMILQLMVALYRWWGFNIRC